MRKNTAVLHCKPSKSEKVHALDASEVMDNGEISYPSYDGCLWSSHPRVFIKLDDKGEALCPYCGSLYQLQKQAIKE